MLRSRRPIATALSACALVLAAAAPASAAGLDASASTTYSDGTAITRAAAGSAFSVASSTIDRLNMTTISQSGEAQTLADDGETARVLVHCSASAPGAAGTGVVACFLQPTGPGRPERYDANEGMALPGVVDVAAGEVLTVPSGAYEICVQSRALLRDGAAFAETPLVCS